MLETKLTTCANLLYQWLLPRTSGGGKFTVDLQDFQAWTAEYRDKPFSDREIVEALRQLKELQLITVSRTEVTLEVKPENNLFFNTERPTEKRARPDRLMQLLRIISGSFFFGLISITFSLILVQIQPQVLSTPNQWSVFGESNIDSGN